MDMNDGDDNNNNQMNRLKQELDLLRERYIKLADIHGKLQEQNSFLEERLLTAVETSSNEKTQLEQMLTDARQQVKHLQATITELDFEKQRYKQDCNLAVQLLHRYPSEFMSTASEHVQEQLKARTESTPTQQSAQSQRNFILPTFPPTFIATTPLLNTTNTSACSTVHSQTTPTTSIAKDGLRLAAEVLFKSNSVYRYPSTHFVCANCHRTVKYCDVSVQTSLNSNDDNDKTSRLRLVSLTSSDDGLSNNDGTWGALEPHHSHMTMQEYQTGSTQRQSENTGFGGSSFHSIPEMHHV